VKELKLEGVYFEREFKRFIPTSGVSAHIVGFTNVDDIDGRKEWSRVMKSY